MFYVVKKGYNPGIYNTWKECEKNILGYKNAKFKKFKNKNDAILFLNNYTVLFKNNNLIQVVNTDIINIYTDGSCLNNGKSNAIAGIGIYFDNINIDNISRRHIGIQTNNNAELTAIIESIKILILKDKILNKINIYTDSMYAILCGTTYGKKNNLNNWKKEIPNKNLVKKIYNLLKTYKNIKLIHVKAHTQNKDIHSINNNKADNLAKNGSRK